LQKFEDLNQDDDLLTSIINKKRDFEMITITQVIISSFVIIVKYFMPEDPFESVGHAVCNSGTIEAQNIDKLFIVWVLLHIFVLAVYYWNKVAYFQRGFEIECCEWKFVFTTLKMAILFMLITLPIALASIALIYIKDECSSVVVCWMACDSFISIFSIIWIQSNEKELVRKDKLLGEFFVNQIY